MEKSDLQHLLDNSDSISDVMRKLDLDAGNGSRKTLHRRIEIDQLSMDQLTKNRKLSSQEFRKSLWSAIRKTPDSEGVLCENSKVSRGCIKKLIARHNLLDWRCAICDLDEWNGKPISLQLDHINGIQNDNRMENLRLLCPNCHSQTENFAGRKKKGKTASKQCELMQCIKCNKPTKTSLLCIVCNNISTRKFEVNKEDLEVLVSQKSFTQIAKMFGVSDNSIRKRCRFLGITVPKNGQGYWTKKRCEERCAGSITGNAPDSKSGVP